jgi:hypothetical protein
MSLQFATIISAIAGRALGILICAVGFVMMFAMVIAIARSDPFWSIIVATAIPGTAIQLGYLAGIFIRAAVE